MVILWWFNGFKWWFDGELIGDSMGYLWWFFMEVSWWISEGFSWLHDRLKKIDSKKPWLGSVGGSDAGQIHRVMKSSSADKSSPSGERTMCQLMFFSGFWRPGSSLACSPSEPSVPLVPQTDSRPRKLWRAPWTRSSWWFQWEVQDPAMEVRYHFSGHRNWWCIPWTIALKFRPNIYGRYLQFRPLTWSLTHTILGLRTTPNCNGIARWGPNIISLDCLMYQLLVLIMVMLPQLYPI